MKKFFSLVILLLISITSVLSFSACGVETPDITVDALVQNVIILIGDGMGKNHIENAKTYFELDSTPFDDDYICSVNTNSRSFGTTDSAAAATAMATGVSVKNGRISYDGKQNLKTILELAHEKGMKTGIVTTDNLNGATPAAFSSHANDRDDTLDIITSQSTSNVDLFIGNYNEDYFTNAELFTNNGYTMCDNVATLATLTNETKVLASLENINSIYNPELTGQTNMVDLVNYSLNYLTQENGFVLMIECAHIDKFSHKNKLIPALAEVRTLFDIATAVYSYADIAHNTAVIITADHETGRLTKASSKSDISDSLYRKTGHSNRYVSLYTRGVTISETKLVKNTFVYDICNKVITK